MLKFLRKLKREQLIGLSFVLALHGAALYGLWSYRIIPAPVEAITLIVNLINPPPPAQPPQPPKQPRQSMPRPIEPPKSQQLVAETPVVMPDDTVAYAAPSPPPPPPVVEAPSLPQQQVALSGELSVSCPERSPPNYPAQSMRLNEQGRVFLRVELGEDGRVSGVRINSTSGFTRLDEAAVNAVKTWRCKPAIRNGIAVPAVALQPFVFILEGR